MEYVPLNEAPKTEILNTKTKPNNNPPVNLLFLIAICSNKIVRIFTYNKIKGFYLVLLFSSFQTFGQQYPFRNYTTNEGLSTNKIICIHQKENKQLWLGTTEGINIYNGNTFQSANQYFKLPNRNVYDISEINGKTYVGTNGGLCVYDGKDTSVFKTGHGLKHNRVYKTFKDRDGIIWIATAAGMHILKGNKITNVDIHPAVNKAPIYNIYEDKKGALWFCSITQGVVRYYKNEAKQFLNNSPSINFVGGALQMNDSTIWFATRNGLFSIINDSTTQININAPEATNYFGIMKNSKGDVWISSNSGAFVYRNNTFKNFTTENGLVHNEIFQIFEDNENSMWFSSTEKGISQLINEKFILEDANNIKSTNITGISKKSDTLLYLSSNEGIVLYNRFNGEIDTLDLPEVEYYNGYYDHQTNKLIVGRNDGVLVVNEDQSYYVVVYNTRDQSLRKCWSIQKDNNGKLWFGTAEGIGHIKDSLISFYKSDGNYHDYVLDVHKSKDGTIYFATELGLTYLDKGKLINYSKEHNFHRARIRQICEDQEGNIWFAGENGLFKQEGDKFKEIKYDHINDQPIHSLAFDKSGQLWAGLRAGVLRFNFSSDTTDIRYFSQFEGFLGKECNIAAIYAGENGEVLFGTENGLVTYRPEFEVDQKINPVIDFSMNVEGIEHINEYADSMTQNNIPINLQLPTNNNHLDFSFKINSLLFGKDIRFKYKLTGFDNEWKTANNDSKVEYSELSYGTYTFQIKVEEHPDLYPTEEIRLTFEIVKPFYLQTWFIGICIIIVITWIYSYYLIRKNVNLLNKQQKIILSQKSTVEEKNREIVDSITYAKRIQDAILPNNELLKNSFSDFFVLYKPRDIVSGDFYWVEKTNNNEVVFAAADCTGHGVPGAMVSLMCSNLLRKVILEEKYNDPGKVLDIVSDDLLKRLDGKKEKVADGMDITLCFWNPSTNTLRFSGAHNPLYHIRGNQLDIYKTDKQPIGYFEDRKPFTTHQIEILENDQIVLFSDGIVDQFGGPKNKKFSSKRFRKEILEHQNLSLEAQKEKLAHTLELWQDSEEQIDDICILSVRF